MEARSHDREEDENPSMVAVKVGPEAADAPLTHGSLWKAIWIMSWPLMLTTVTSSIVGMVDVQVAGMLGASTQAAVGLSEQILFLFMVFIMSVSVGTTAIVSRAFGAKDTQESIRGTSQSLSLSVLMGLLLTVVAWLIAKFIVPFFSNHQFVIDQSRLYLSIFALYLIPFSIVAIVNSAFRAIGDAKTPLVIVVVMTTINVVGDYATVLWNFPVPGLGVRGIALSAVFSSAIGATIAIWRLSRSPLRDGLTRIFPLRFDLMRRIIDIGVPSALQRWSWAAAVFVLFFILSRCPNPTEALAAWTIGMRIEGLLFMPLMALSLAISSIVGQNLGARRPKRAFQAGWNVSWIGIAMMLLLATGMFAFAPGLSAWMSQDPKTIEYTVSYLRINAIAEPFLALGMVLSGALQGAGDTKTPMWISVVSNWIVRLPLAWMLAITLHLGPTGAWISMAVSVLMTAVLVTWRYQSKAWIRQKV
jgi:MATE family multidrug resistance protein